MNEQKKSRYITATLPYVNADPHIGFALELAQADCVARYWRLQGHDVFFNTGTDEHGQKIAQKADELGQDRQMYVDEYAAKFSALEAALNLSNDAFIRTTDAKHQAAAQEIWRRCAAAGDIYKKKYTGLYCVGCEVFYKEDELDENNCCLIHKKPVEEVAEENYFFRLSKYQDQLVAYLEDESRTPTNWARKWTLDFAKRGLDDVSISRHTSRMDWGIPVPGDDEHVMYVWFDALTNYISTLDWPATLSSASATETEEGKPAAENLYEKFWVNGETVQMAGKDQMRFQSLIWQAMLLSAELPQTDVIHYHGFINVDGQKMSKSIGNVISPYEVVEKYGTDATRYILLRHMHPNEDSDLTWEKMDEWYTANLVNGLGNLTARIMKMAETHLDAPASESAYGFEEAYESAIESFDFHVACDFVWSKIQELDEEITEKEPFKLVKEDKAAAQELIASLATRLYKIGCYLYPIMPEANVIIKEAVLANKKPDNLFNRLES